MKVPTDILTQEESEKAKERLDLIFSTWYDLCQNHTLTNEFKNSFFLSVPITTEATLRYILDVRRIKQFHPEEIENINEYKIAGYLIYWICKLKQQGILWL
ncbi:hypothetical protein [Leptospira ilyithenensis]|uniref:Uncharacterized protein n=1 Tax=Leptospira ilyithenensis TaxID=2484901 RepID=A0A4R9LIX0_9LEPT|nr:hypothetical protein [Leptospira ilyithenensis]TGN06552.1 hypothetical protein EHS11_19575 [Leptospira ilyithenensis]